MNTQLRAYDDSKENPVVVCVTEKNVFIILWPIFFLHNVRKKSNTSNTHACNRRRSTYPHQTQTCVAARTHAQISGALKLYLIVNGST